MFDFSPLPNKAAQDYWQDKIQVSPGLFSRLTDEARLRAFAVSGIAAGDELATVFSALTRAIDDGISYGEFKKQAADVFARRGWTGKAAWRVDNIFRTNIQTAYNVGRYRQMADAASRRPYWQYDAVNDSRTRPTHAAMDGRVWPADHPVWNTWYPPCGFRCRCSVRSLSASGVQRRGLTVEEQDPTGGLIEPVDPRTGQKMPARPLIPDQGFDLNPGKSVWGGIVDGQLAEGRKLNQLPNLPGASDFRRPAAGNLKKLPPAPEMLASLDALREAGLSNRQARDHYLKKFREAFGLEEDDAARVFSVGGQPVIVSQRMVTGRGGRVKITKGDRGQYVPLFSDALLDPDEVWLTPMKDDAGKVILRRRHLKFWRGDQENLAGFAVMDIEGGVWNGVSIYDVAAGQTGETGDNLLDGPEGYRRGLLLHKKEAK